MCLYMFCRDGDSRGWNFLNNGYVEEQSFRVVIWRGRNMLRDILNIGNVA